MQVPDDMRNEGGIPVKSMADYLDDDGAGVRAAISERGDRVRLVTDSTSTSGRPVFLDADDCEGLADLLRERARELRRREGRAQR